MIYTIDQENNISAFAAAKDIENPETVQQFKSAKGLNKLAVDWPTERLIAIWNGLPGMPPLNKFRSRETGMSRIWAAIQGLSAQAARTPKPSQKAPQAATPREGTRKSLVIELLGKPNGASVAEIMKLTGWQPHSVRGFISGSLIKKSGLKVESFKREDGQRAYAVR